MNFNNKKTYFIDLDGTLLDKYGINRISRKNIMAIRVLKNFANVVLSTGRSFYDHRVKQTMYQLGLNDIINASGAQIYRNGVLQWQNTLNLELVKEIASWAKKNKIIYAIFDDKGDFLYTNNCFDYFVNKMILNKKFTKIFSRKIKNPVEHSGVVKIALVNKNKFKAKQRQEEFRKIFGDRTNSFLASNNYILEITNKEANKGKAIDVYCEMFDLDTKNTVHIGDSMSDAAVKGHVGKLVAMENSVPELKEIADEIAPSFKKSGIYKYFTQPSKNKKGENND
ncbi:Cof-type HAD-IIB family hydrolase [Mycoplasma sp. Mirounga ES2805-ORL]|uniref:Cof-type HAD-IIB family hydrolase n=1 Tax=Mycoplasma sp. Mirounga ES2805-ORL TaxID=754514 RepID=UPI00197C2313|nr:Cof-type HAD-IIB family hydrolase [Mycoplasma sp. Mirounga ES2805-ORL]QSF13574.1 Cof-type HAD-IIB family hydrolase [Mycoplasma sp. Mirounga ES2805-ORL]